VESHALVFALCLRLPLVANTVISRSFLQLEFFSRALALTNNSTMNPPSESTRKETSETVAVPVRRPKACPAVYFLATRASGSGSRSMLFQTGHQPQGNLTFLHQLSNTITMHIGYVGQHGTHLLNFENLAQRIGLNAYGNVAKPGELIVSQTSGPFLGCVSIPCSTASAGGDVWHIRSLYGGRSRTRCTIQIRLACGFTPP